MTQDKRFKKDVRARMAKTGESYTRALRVLKGPQEEGPPTYVLVGYWKSLEEPNWPDPIDMVDASWDSQERSKVIQYLRSGYLVASFMGDSWCRLGCGSDGLPGERSKSFFEANGTEEGNWKDRRKSRHIASKRSEEANLGAAPEVDMGASEFSDGVYVWPEGLAHYLEKHHVRLPQRFVDHVLREGAPKEPTTDHDSREFSYDSSFWDSPTGIQVELPRTVVIESPFPEGWYFHDAEYPDEGSEGPYKTRHDAEHAALQSGNDGQGNFDEVFQEWLHGKLTIEQAFEKMDVSGVAFWEQQDNATVMQQYMAEYLKTQMRELGAVAGKKNSKEFRESMRDRITGMLSAVRFKAEKAGVKVPSESGIRVTFPELTARDAKNKVLRVVIHIDHPEKYPQFVRDLVDEGVLEPRHRVSMQLKEGN